MAAATFGPYPAIVLNVHDGDTIKLAVDLGFDITFKVNCRVFGINAPELRTTAGKKSRDFLQERVKPGDFVKVLSHGWDKYGGRFDGTITLADGSDVASMMLLNKQAVVFEVD